jgi:hypothetical protein
MADITITAANVLYTSGGVKHTGTAGAAITAGQCVYLDSATSTIKLAQCDGSAAEAAAVGIALHAAGIGQPITYAGQDAVINIGGTTAKTTTYLVSAAAGGVAPQADITTSTHRITRLGYATATDGSFVVDLKVTGVQV